MKARTAVYYDPVFLEHDTGFHPENAKRLEAIVDGLKSAPFAGNLYWPPSFPPATIEQIETVHDPGYIRLVEKKCRSGARALDADTIICQRSWDAALMAAGALVAATGAVIAGDFANAFCAVRPPGHHATPGRAMGFCLFNNVAVGARHAIQAHGLERAAIIDFDVHHGNGTQDIFYGDPAVCYVSLHQAYHYPGTGAEDERGAGGAEGTVMNFPMQAGSGDEDYLQKFDAHIIPTLEKFAPGVIFVSAGFDGHEDDPLASMSLTAEGYGAMTQRIMELAGRLGHGRIVSALEGGYDLGALRESAVAHVERLAAG